MCVFMSVMETVWDGISVNYTVIKETLYTSMYICHTLLSPQIRGSWGRVGH